jgi:hypothetical protein
MKAGANAGEANSLTLRALKGNARFRRCFPNRFPRIPLSPPQHIYKLWYLNGLKYAAIVISHVDSHILLEESRGCRVAQSLGLAPGAQLRQPHAGVGARRTRGYDGARVGWITWRTT